ncbi:hypothetical protein C789_5394 [Microcystis aeruginosa FACHB-905 = DIANCHI905]|nr:hypothetical protein C789_5394 [Microcystis aeruginosa FACHB-905 = DIANCHI905]
MRVLGFMLQPNLHSIRQRHYAVLNLNCLLRRGKRQTPSDIGVGLIHESTLLLINPTINQPYY